MSSATPATILNALNWRYAVKQCYLNDAAAPKVRWPVTEVVRHL